MKPVAHIVASQFDAILPRSEVNASESSCILAILSTAAFAQIPATFKIIAFKQAETGRGKVISFDPVRTRVPYIEDGLIISGIEGAAFQSDRGLRAISRI